MFSTTVRAECWNVYYTHMDSDVITRTVERHDLEAERLLSNSLDQHQIAALQQFIQLFEFLVTT